MHILIDRTHIHVVAQLLKSDSDYYFITKMFNCVNFIIFIFKSRGNIITN